MSPSPPRQQAACLSTASTVAIAAEDAAREAQYAVETAKLFARAEYTRIVAERARLEPGSPDAARELDRQATQATESAEQAARVEAEMKRLELQATIHRLQAEKCTLEEKRRRREAGFSLSPSPGRGNAKAYAVAEAEKAADMAAEMRRLELVGEIAKLKADKEVLSQSVWETSSVAKQASQVGSRTREARRRALEAREKADALEVEAEGASVSVEVLRMDRLEQKAKLARARAEDEKARCEKTCEGPMGHEEPVSPPLQSPAVLAAKAEVTRLANQLRHQENGAAVRQQRAAESLPRQLVLVEAADAALAEVSYLADKALQDRNGEAVPRPLGLPSEHEPPEAEEP